MIRTLILFALMFSMMISAQDLRGKWVSVLDNEDVDEFTLNYKNGERYSGESYDSSYGGEFCNYTFEAKYNESTKEFLGFDKDLIEKTESHTRVAYRLKYSKATGKEYLTGTGQLIYDDGSLGYPFAAKYMRQYEEEKEQIQSYEPSQKEIEQIQNYKKTRKNPRKALIRMPSKFVTLKIYDYGEEDNDTISIIYNNQLLAYKTPINKNVKEYQLELVPGQDNRITFIADNLGDVPPNTTQVELVSDDKKFNYTLFTNLKTNAVIDLRLQD